MSAAAIAPRERPILFSAPMVRAILAGTKAQTRRVVKAPKECTVHGRRPYWDRATVDAGGTIYGPGPYLHLPYSMDGGAGDWASARVYPRWGVGDLLWVRETWRGFDLDGGRMRVEYQAGGEERVVDMDELGGWPYIATKAVRAFPEWRPSVHMPRWASRLTLHVTSVRVERLQDISGADAKEEGYPHGDDPSDSSAAWYARLWDTINGGRAGFAWTDNPWVWAITFEREGLGA